MSKKYCKFPWTWSNVKLQNDQWRFCCKTTYLDYAESVEVLDNVKTSFIAHQEHSACDACWRQEDAGSLSYRTSMNGQTRHEAIVHFFNKKPSIEWIDIEFGDTCNMYCATCGPGNSSKWQQLLKIFPNENNKFDLAWPRLHDMIMKNIESLHHLNIYGGEPSVDPNFHSLVDNLTQAKFPKKLGIQIYTNGNYSDNHQVKFEKGIDKLKDHGWDIDLNFSLDAPGEDGEFIRGGLKFDRFEKNLRKIIDMGIMPFINISTSILNIENQVNIYHWLKSAGLQDKIIPKINIVSRPYWASISNLGNKISDFMPQWPDDIQEEHWITYKDRLTQNLAKNLSSTVGPDHKMIQLMMGNINKYSKMNNDIITPYYQDYFSRLDKI